MQEGTSPGQAEDPGIRRVLVVGAGTMGHGIAQAAAQAGARVVLADRTEELVRAGLERIRGNLDSGVERGKVTSSERDEALSHLSPATDVAMAAEDVDLAVEAVPERLDLKHQVLGTLETAAPARAILASNTSSLSVSALQEPLERPERVLGMHFFNPVHIMKLVEVVRGRATGDEAVATAVAFARRMGKEPIVVKDSPGFASSRLGVALGLEAMRM
ncbi:MAG TPA: 3-hydroxyacyl-CoA dehydrogenase family protein, partial [Longimicrobiales bacterium]|nr:3-hydroxyacyl-CoA dehydrogenase family protein [Longimicrobiales bacterium]